MEILLHSAFMKNYNVKPMHEQQKLIKTWDNKVKLLSLRNGTSLASPNPHVTKLFFIVAEHEKGTNFKISSVNTR